MMPKTKSEHILFQRVFNNNKFSVYLRDGVLYFKQSTKNFIPYNEIIKSYYNILNFSDEYEEALKLFENINIIGNNRIFGDYYLLKTIFENSIFNIMKQYENGNIDIYLENRPSVLFLYDAVINNNVTKERNNNINIKNIELLFTEYNPENCSIVILENMSENKAKNVWLQYVEENNDFYIIALFDDIGEAELLNRCDVLINTPDYKDIFGCGYNENYSKFLFLKRNLDPEKNSSEE